MNTKNKKVGSVIVGLLIISLLSYSCKSIQPTNDELVGKWVITNHKQESFILHDTIEFDIDRFFNTTIVANTNNTGKWKKIQSKIILKSCLHTVDNPNKCRDFKWKWLITEFESDRMIIIQNGEEKSLEYRRIK